MLPKVILCYNYVGSELAISCKLAVLATTSCVRQTITICSDKFSKEFLMILAGNVAVDTMKQSGSWLVLCEEMHCCLGGGKYHPPVGNLLTPFVSTQPSGLL